jgi:hypothetical protein
MLAADRKLKDRSHQTEATLLEAEAIQHEVDQACDALFSSLTACLQQQPGSALELGAYVFRETYALLMSSAFIDRAYSKPRGYAGDYGTIQMIYNDQPHGVGRLGPFIDRWVLQIAACRAVKNRRGLLTAALREIAASWKAAGPMPVTSLASGPARELFDLFGSADAPNLRAICIDIDEEALAFAAEIARGLGVSDRFRLAQENVIRLSRGRGTLAIEPQQVIYSIGLIDYLADSHIVTLINWAYEQLLPGGTLILGNFAVGNPDQAFMEHILEWSLLHRSTDDLRALFAQSSFGDCPVEVRSEPSGVNLFAFCAKPGAAYSQCGPASPGLLKS